MMLAGGNPEPRKNVIKSLPSIYQIEDYISLPKPNKKLTASFFEVIDNRKSERIFSKLTLEQISNLLWYSSKTKTISVTNENQFLSHRNAPSAGGIHPIDIFVSLPSDFDKRVLHYYDPFVHKLANVNLKQSSLSLFFDNINRNLSIENSTIIWFAASIQRTGSKYKNPESLVWRDAGALIVLYQLVATALQINSCPVGTLGNPFFVDLFSKEMNVTSAGGILFG